MSLHVKSFFGEQIADIADEVGALRIKNFKEFPYLYEGKLCYESEYLKTISTCKESCVELLFDGEKVCGCSVHLPLRDAWTELARRIEKSDLHVEEFYYFSELIIEPNYRNMGFSQIFREAASLRAKELGFNKIMMATVKRDENHPQKPTGYISFDEVAKKYGFKVIPHVEIEAAWKSSISGEDEVNIMKIWSMNIV